MPVRTVCCARLAAEGGKRAGFYVACPAASPTGAGDGSRLHSFISDDSIIACLLDTTRWCRAAIVYQGERRGAKDKHTNGVHNEAKVPLDFPPHRKSFPKTTRHILLVFDSPQLYSTDHPGVRTALLLVFVTNFCEPARVHPRSIPEPSPRCRRATPLLVHGPLRFSPRTATQRPHRHRRPI